jgi:hypothetical protein
VRGDLSEFLSVLGEIPDELAELTREVREVLADLTKRVEALEHQIRPVAVAGNGNGHGPRNPTMAEVLSSWGKR